MEIKRHRNKLPRSTFHVMNRGARKVSIFADQADRRIFVGLLGRFATKYEVPILAWCLMPNHYHVETDTDGPRLCGMLRDLDGNYARSFNERHDTTGCLFQGPFKSVMIEDRIGVAHVSRYIHLNPVDLGEAPAQYPWSSCAAYLGLKEAPPWLDLDPVTSILRNEDLSDLENYQRYLEEGLALPRKGRKADPLADFTLDWVRFLESQCIERLTGKEQLLGKLNLQTLVCFIAHRLHRVPAEVVAEYFGCSPATVRNACSRLRQRALEDPQVEVAIRTATNSAAQNW